MIRACYFSAPGPHADLPSFPTRRSSDLVLRGRGLDLRRGRVLQRGLDVGSAVDRGDDDSGALLLARGEVGADGLRIVDGEDRVDLRVARQIALRDGEAAFARALAVLVARQHLDAGRLGEHA